MKVVAKFFCQSKVAVSNTANDGFEIALTAVTTGSKENEEFFKWTPTGSLSLRTVNPTAAAAFHPGEFYLLTIEPAAA